MLFVYHLGRPKSDTFHKLAVQFFLDIENGNYEGVITTFTQTEYIAVMKELLSQRIGAPLSLTQLNTLRSEFETFIDKEGIELLDSDDLSTSVGHCEIFKWSSQVVDACRAVMGRHDYKWRTIGGADAIHAVFANRAGSDLLVTFDGGFKAISSLASAGWKLRPLIIPDVYHP
jgi:predicted nucleic acid-binding protein